MAKPLDMADFRAIRIVLEPDDFAVSSGKPDEPTDLVDKDTWHGIIDLPDDVSIRTSNHQGTILKELYTLQSTWTTHAIGDEQDLLFEVLPYTIDELDAALFNALHGYYRQAIECLRNIVELVQFGTHCQMAKIPLSLSNGRRGTMRIPLVPPARSCSSTLPFKRITHFCARPRTIRSSTGEMRRNQGMGAAVVCRAVRVFSFTPQCDQRRLVAQ